MRGVMKTREIGARASSPEALPSPLNPAGPPPPTGGTHLGRPGSRAGGARGGRPLPGGRAGVSGAGSAAQDGSAQSGGQAAGLPGLGRGLWGVGGTLAEPLGAPPPPGHRTHPGRAPAGKWQSQWKAAAQCAHRSASVPSPHTPHRAPDAGPCGADGAVTAAGKGALPILHPPPQSQGPRRGWTAGGARAGEGWFGVPAPEGGCLAPLGCSPEKPGAPTSLLLGGPGPPSGLQGSLKWHSPKEA